MQKKGQGAFEYILMLSGILLIVILIIIILQGSLAGANNKLNESQAQFGNTVRLDVIKPDTTLGLLVLDTTGSVTSGNAGTPPCFTDGSSCKIKCPSKYFNNATGSCS